MLGDARNGERLAWGLGEAALNGMGRRLGIRAFVGVNAPSTRTERGLMPAMSTAAQPRLILLAASRSIIAAAAPLTVRLATTNAFTAA
jgi:hypothetical protein